ncbi:MAG: DegT/DnrJ/EryC1/StrS family aminotransferase [Acidimicrobiales bacterium]
MTAEVVRRAHVANATLSPSELSRAVARPLPIDRAERLIEEMLEVDQAVLFASARGALAAAVGVLARKGTVALPAYTCVAVANAIRSGDATPIYVDVDQRGLVPVDRWPDADLVLVQDTYGFVSEPPAGRRVVRDCAHRVDLVQTRGCLCRITSFEHSKWLTSGQGGLAVTEDADLARAMRQLRDQRTEPSETIKHAGVTLATLVAGRLQFQGRSRPAYWVRRVPEAFAPDRLRGQSRTELNGEGVAPPLLGRPNRVVARLIVSQLRQLQAVSESRSQVVALYDRIAGMHRDAVPLVRYPLLVGDPHAVESRFVKGGWDVSGRWFNAPLHPVGANAERLGFNPGSAPQAERLAASVINLPTHPLVSEKDATRLIELALEVEALPVA